MGCTSSRSLNEKGVKKLLLSLPPATHGEEKVLDIVEKIKNSHIENPFDLVISQNGSTLCHWLALFAASNNEITRDRALCTLKQAIRNGARTDIMNNDGLCPFNIILQDSLPKEYLCQGPELLTCIDGLLKLRLSVDEKSVELLQEVGNSSYIVRTSDLYKSIFKRVKDLVETKDIAEEESKQDVATDSQIAR